MNKKKNILVIMTDQQRKDSLGCYGNTIVSTPNIDSLAAEGVRFNRYYVANPICMPNRLSIFTGTYPQNHCLWTNGVYHENERRTLGHELGDLGYQTASFGKVHFTPGGGKTNWESSKVWKELGDNFNWSGPYWGFQHVEFANSHSSNTIAHYGKWFRNKGGTEEMFDILVKDDGETGIRKLPIEFHESTFVGQRTAEFIAKERDKDKPFFVVASFPDPHHPWNPPEECAGRYSPDEVIEPIGGPDDLQTRPPHYFKHFQGAWHRTGERAATHPEGISKEVAKKRIAYTYAMVDLIDRNVGTILNTLKQNDLYEDTIIIFTTDHGELQGDHGLWHKGPFFYEGLVNIPLIITAPGAFNPGVTNKLASSIDIMPTIMDLLQLQLPAYVDGISLKRNLLNDEEPVRERCLIEYRNGYGKADVSSKVIVTENMKYARYQSGECELTDLKNDPEEKNNLSNLPEYREVINKMNEIMLDEILSTGCKWPPQICFA